MDAQAKKTALRMIPYGLYVLTAQGTEGDVAASTISWVTQASFEPPLLAVGAKVGSGAHALTQQAGFFALNVLGKDQDGIAYKFFKSVKREGMSVGGEPFDLSENGTPLLAAVPAWIECKLVEVVEKGDHAIFIAEVVNARVRSEIKGRPDETTLWVKDLGDKVFYGG